MSILHREVSNSKTLSTTVTLFIWIIIKRLWELLKELFIIIFMEKYN